RHVVLRGAGLGATLAGLLFAGGSFGQPFAGAISKGDAESIGPAADPVSPIGDPTSSDTDSTNPISEVTAPTPKPTRNYDRFYFQTSLLTWHFHYDPKHDDHSRVLNAEYRFDKEWLGGRWMAGAAAFDNSFGQRS